VRVPVLLGAVAVVALSGVAMAQNAPSALGGFGNSKDPVRVDSETLEVFDKEQRAVYAGDVVVTQGPSTLRCTQLTVFYARGTAQPAANASASATPSTGNSIKRLECKGPVSAVSGNSTVTGDNGTYEAATQIVEVIGNVILTDCKNVQKGDKLVYNLKTGVAKVTGGRVSGIFEQGGAADGACQ
jgi:lipopolysaccharide export system protein LptA